MVSAADLFNISFFECSETEKTNRPETHSAVKNVSAVLPGRRDSLQLDTAIYNAMLLHLAHHKPGKNWPVRTVYPLNGAIISLKRIVTYYGNFYSKRMGILGELPPDRMLNKLQQEIKKWELADALTPVLGALQYIAVTAQRSPGKDRKYRLRMPFSQVDKALKLAERIDWYPVPRCAGRGLYNSMFLAGFWMWMGAAYHIASFSTINELIGRRY